MRRPDAENPSARCGKQDIRADATTPGPVDARDIQIDTVPDTNRGPTAGHPQEPPRTNTNPVTQKASYSCQPQ